jgi:hypothetical protein
MATRTADFSALSGAVLADSGKAAGEILARSVIPLSVYNRRQRPEHVATGTLLRVDGRHFLVTAGHAVVQTREQHLFAGFEGIKLQRVPALVRQASRVNVLQVDDLDIRLMPLPASKLGEFVRGEFLDVNSLNADHLPDLRRKRAPDYLVYGYSAGRSQLSVDHKARVLHQLSFHLRTYASPMDSYSKQKLDPRRHLVLNHDPKDVLIGGQLQTMPQMKGVSGGAVIHCPPDRKPALVAIVIEHHKDRRTIVSTRVSHVIEFARHMILNSDPVNFA